VTEFQRAFGPFVLPKYSMMIETPYKSFWMGGFEGADHVNEQGARLDMVAWSGHLASVESDYEQLAKMDIKTVRESVGWRISQPTIDSHLDLSRAVAFAEAAKKHDIQLIWTFMHYGTPEGVSLLDDSFVDHFVEYATKVAETLAPFDDAPVFNLINEISFLSWATSQTNFMWPYQGKPEGARSEAARQGFVTKCRLVRAVLKAMEAVRDVCPAARFLHVEPLVHMVTPFDKPELEELAQEIRSHQWQVWELLRGTMEPQLGGYPEALDLMGVNYYYNGQMEVVTDKYLEWIEPDPRRLPFNALLEETWGRYRRPLIISETGHMDDTRALWLDRIFKELKDATDSGVPIEGVCVYPISDRPCWHDIEKIIKCGIIQLDHDRSLHQDSIETIRRWQQRFKEAA